MFWSLGLVVLVLCLHNWAVKGCYALLLGPCGFGVKLTGYILGLLCRYCVDQLVGG